MYPKEHYLACECGKNSCTCVIIPRGYITDTDFPNLNVPIYQTAGVSDEDAITTTNNIKSVNGYAGMQSGYRNQLANANNF